MGKAAVKRLLCVYFILLFGAVIFRVDYFPFSWVPMYGLRKEGPTHTVPVGDIKRRELGFDAMRANGERTTLSRRDLNIPPANFRRLYHERAFGLGPPHHWIERAGLMAFNRWWYETLVGPDPEKNANYQAGLLDSFNRTFELGPGNPRRFVTLEAHLDFATFSRKSLAEGKLHNPLRERRVAIITPGSAQIQNMPHD